MPISESEYSLTLADISDIGKLQERIRSETSGIVVRDVAIRMARAARLLLESNPTDARAAAIYVPGRVEVLGKHTDYAGGTSLTCAVCRAFIVVSVETGERGIRLLDEARGQSCFLSYDSPGSTIGPPWAIYPAAVARRVVQATGKRDRGVSMAFTSDIPRAAGLSSSSAFVVAVWLSMAATLDLMADPVFESALRTSADLADFLGSVESGNDFRSLMGTSGVGTHGGSQDHAAVLFSESGRIGHYGYMPIRRLSSLEFPDGYIFVIASSGVRAGKAFGAREKYNRAVRLAEIARVNWTSKPRSMREMIDDPDFSVQRLNGILDEAGIGSTERDAVVSRVEQFRVEVDQIIPGAVRALDVSDIVTFGSLAARSQNLAESCLNNQVPETSFLASSAYELGAGAASSFGAGFGGSVWAMVRSEDSDEFTRKWMSEYGKHFPGRLRGAHFFCDRPGPGAFVLGENREKLRLSPGL